MERKLFSQYYRLDDAASMFWWDSPKLVRTAFQYAFFANSLTISVLILSLWQARVRCNLPSQPCDF